MKVLTNYMKKLGTNSMFGVTSEHFRYKEFLIVRSLDNISAPDILQTEFGTTKMPLGEYEHISISREDRYPTWDELTAFKDYFFGDVFAFMMMPPASHYVNVHRNCFHLWRPL